MSRKWETWRCTHACTAFFRIAREEVEHLVPRPLELAIDGEGKAAIEVGYVRFREGNGEAKLPAVEEIAWAIAVKRTRRFTRYAFYAMNLTSEHEGMLVDSERKGFRVYRPPVRFEVDLDLRAYRVTDGTGGHICTLRHNPEGGFTLPAFLSGLFVGTTEVFTGTRRHLFRHEFQWVGVARPHFAPLVASSLEDHPFFLGAKVSRAEPIPHEAFSSVRVASRAAQRFTTRKPFP